MGDATEDQPDPAAAERVGGLRASGAPVRLLAVEEDDLPGHVSTDQRPRPALQPPAADGLRRPGNPHHEAEAVPDPPALSDGGSARLQQVRELVQVSGDPGDSPGGAGRSDVSQGAGEHQRAETDHGRVSEHCAGGTHRLDQFLFAKNSSSRRTNANHGQPFAEHKEADSQPPTLRRRRDTRQN